MAHTIKNLETHQISPMSPETPAMDLPPKNEDEVTQDDINKRLEGLKLDDKFYDEFRVYKRLNQTESSATADLEKYISRNARLTCSRPSDVLKSNEGEIPSTETNIPDGSPTGNTIPSECVEPRTTTTTPLPGQTLIRFRRPVLSDDLTPGMTDSYETLTLSEVQEMDSQWDRDLDTPLEESQLALGDFNELDEFEEVDEFEDDWEEEVGVDGEWEVEEDEDAYCEGDDCEEDILDDQN
jgi:hypothetical protein